MIHQIVNSRKGVTTPLNSLGISEKMVAGSIEKHLESISVLPAIFLG